MKKHASGYWYEFLIPRRITLKPVRIYRWLNFYWRLKDEEEQMNADDFFQELGYAIEQHKSYVKYYDGQGYIWFDYNYRDIEITASIGVNELKAINKKVEELGWNRWT